MTAAVGQAIWLWALAISPSGCWMICLLALVFQELSHARMTCAVHHSDQADGDGKEHATSYGKQEAKNCLRGDAVNDEPQDGMLQLKTDTQAAKTHPVTGHFNTISGLEPSVSQNYNLLQRQNIIVSQHYDYIKRLTELITIHGKNTNKARRVIRLERRLVRGLDTQAYLYGQLEQMVRTGVDELRYIKGRAEALKEKDEAVREKGRSVEMRKEVMDDRTAAYAERDMVMEERKEAIAEQDGLVGKLKMQLRKMYKEIDGLWDLIDA